MPHFHGAFGAFANHGERVRQKVVQSLAIYKPLTKFVRFGAQGLVVQGLKLGFHRVDAGNTIAVLLQQPVIAAAKNSGQKIICHEITLLETGRGPRLHALYLKLSSGYGLSR